MATAFGAKEGDDTMPEVSCKRVYVEHPKLVSVLLGAHKSLPI